MNAPSVRAIRSIAVTYDAAAVEAAGDAETGAAEAAAVEAIGDVVREVIKVCRACGWEVLDLPLPAGTRELFETILGIEADVVVNLVESYRGKAALESCVAATYELAGLTFTGASSTGLSLCLHKPHAQPVLRDAGIAVPFAIVAVSADDPAIGGAKLPSIVKPSAQDASHGIDARSVCNTIEEVRDRVGALCSRGLGPALVEELIVGREFNCSVIEQVDSSGARSLKALPVAEIDYSDFPEGVPKILTFNAKWAETSDEYKGSVSRRASIDAPIRAELEAIALRAFAALGVRDYARVDFRMDERGPFVIDVNPNPDLSRGAGLHLAAERAGMTYETLVEGIVRSAFARGPGPWSAGTFGGLNPAQGTHNE